MEHLIVTFLNVKSVKEKYLNREMRNSAVKSEEWYVLKGVRGASTK